MRGRRISPISWPGGGHLIQDSAAIRVDRCSPLRWVSRDPPCHLVKALPGQSAVGGEFLCAILKHKARVETREGV